MDISGHFVLGTAFMQLQIRCFCFFYILQITGALAASVIFAVGTSVFTVISLFCPQVYYGFGFLAGCVLFYFIVMIRLERYTRRLPYYILSIQPVVAEDKSGYLPESDVLWMRNWKGERTLTGIKKINLISAVLVSLSLCGGCTLEKAGNSSQDQAVQEDNETEQVKTEKAEKEEINEMHLRDKDSLYENADDTSVVTMYLTVSKGNSSENTYHTWKEINSYSVYDYEDMGVERYQVAGLLQVGDENALIEGEVGYGESVPNATVQIRGQTSSQNAQKNYKIELKRIKERGEDREPLT